MKVSVNILFWKNCRGSVAYSKFYTARRRQTNVLRFPVGHEYNNYNYLHYLAYLHYLQISTQTRGIELPWHKILRIIPQLASHWHGNLKQDTERKFPLLHLIYIFSLYLQYSLQIILGISRGDVAVLAMRIITESWFINKNTK